MLYAISLIRFSIPLFFSPANVFLFDDTDDTDDDDTDDDDTDDDDTDDDDTDDDDTDDTDDDDTDDDDTDDDDTDDSGGIYFFRGREREKNSIIIKNIMINILIINMTLSNQR